MGILDPKQFGGATGGSGQPGWLDPVLTVLGPSQGFDQPQPNANTPPVNAATEGASGPAGAANPFAALFANASPISPPATTPGLGDRLGAAFMNFANARGFMPAIAGATSGLATGQRTDPIGMMQAQRTAAAQALVNAGLSPALAQAAVLNPTLLQALLPRLMQAPPATTAASAPAPQPPRGPATQTGQ